MEIIGLKYKESSRLIRLNYTKYLKSIIIGVIFWFVFWTQLDIIRLFAGARNATRQNHVNQIMDAINAFQSDNGYSEQIEKLPKCDDKKSVQIGTANGNIDLFEILTEEYISSIPVDPLRGNAKNTGYDMCYTRFSRIKIEAMFAEDGKRVAVIR